MNEHSKAYGFVTSALACLIWSVVGYWFTRFTGAPHWASWMCAFLAWLLTALSISVRGGGR